MRLPLRLRILLAFLIAVGMAVGTAAYGVHRIHRIGDGLSLLNAAYLPLARTAARLDSYQVLAELDIQRLARNLPRPPAGTPPPARLYADRIRELAEQARPVVERGLEMARAPEDVAVLTALAGQLDDLLRLQAAYRAELEAIPREASGAVEPPDALLAAQGALREEVGQFGSRVDGAIRRLSEHTQEAQRRAFLLAGVLTASAALVGGAFALLSVLALRPVTELTREVQRIAGGDYATRLVPRGRDELAVLAREVNAMAASIQQRDEALRRRAAELHAAREHLRSVLDSIRLALVVVEDGTARLVNPAARSLWGVEPGRPLPDELLEDPPGGVRRTPEGRIEALRRHPFRRGAILVGEDITRQVRDRERLARSERLALVGQLLAQVTHEVRNPLNALSLNAELLAEDLEALPPDRREEAHAILATMRRAIDDLTRITESYLDLARRPPPDPAPLDPAELAHEVAALVEPSFRRAGVELRLALPREPPRPLEADGSQVRQALLNVLRNAAEAGAGRVTLAVEDEAAEVCFAVEDDGPGLPPELQERVFEPFFSTRETGTGIGLSIARQVVEDHGGTIRFADVPRGARVELRLPRG